MIYWQSLADFLAMGGRGFFVWGSYGLSLLLIVIEIWLLRRSRRQSLRRLQQLQALERD